MNIEDWKSQIRRGTLEYCILLMLHNRTCYGYEILQKLEKHPIITAKESTIYPLLRRLLKDKCLEAPCPRMQRMYAGPHRHMGFPI